MTTHFDGPTRRLALAVIVALALGLLPGRASTQESCLVVGDDVVISAGETRTCDPSLGIWNGDLRIREGGTVDGDAWVLGGDLLVEPGGTLNGDGATTGSAQVDGAINGDLFAAGGIVLGDSADIDGDAATLGGIERADGAAVGGALRARDRDSGGDGRALGATGARSGRSGAAGRLLGAAVLALVSLLFAALAVTVAPQAVGHVRDAGGGSPVASFAVGLLALGLFPILFVLLLVTVVGAIALPVVYLVAVAIGWVALGELVGTRLAPAGSRVRRAAVGAGLLSLASSAMGWLAGAVSASEATGAGTVLMCVSFAVIFVVVAWALGASLLTVFGMRPWPRTGVARPIAPDRPIVPLPGALPHPAQPPSGTGPAGPGEAPAPLETSPAYPSAWAPTYLAGPVAAESESTPEPEDLAAGEAPPEHAGPLLDPGDATAAWTWPEDAPASAPAAADAPDPTETGASEGWPAWDAAASAGSAPDVPTGSGDWAPDDAGAGQTADEGPTPGWGWREGGDEVPGEVEGPSGLIPSPAPAEPTISLELQGVPGITPIYAYLLREAGIRSVEDLAAATPETVAEIISVPGVLPVGADLAAKWIRAAADLTPPR